MAEYLKIKQVGILSRSAKLVRLALENREKVNNTKTEALDSSFDKLDEDYQKNQERAKRKVTRWLKFQMPKPKKIRSSPPNTVAKMQSVSTVISIDTSSTVYKNESAFTASNTIEKFSDNEPDVTSNFSEMPSVSAAISIQASSTVDKNEPSFTASTPTIEKFSDNQPDVTSNFSEMPSVSAAISIDTSSTVDKNEPAFTASTPTIEKFSDNQPDVTSSFSEMPSVSAAISIHTSSIVDKNESVFTSTVSTLNTVDNVLEAYTEMQYDFADSTFENMDFGVTDGWVIFDEEGHEIARINEPTDDLLTSTVANDNILLISNIDNSGSYSTTADIALSRSPSMFNAEDLGLLTVELVHRQLINYTTGLLELEDENKNSEPLAGRRHVVNPTTGLLEEDLENGDHESAIVNIQTNDTPIKLPKKKKITLQNWKRNMRKASRNCGEDYINVVGKRVQKKQFKPLQLNHKCRMMCKENT